MSSGIKIRLAAFILAIASMLALIGWTAHSAWSRGEEMRVKLAAVQSQSFQIAGHLQQTILELDNLVLRYGLYHNDSDWALFETESKLLDNWIDEQRPIESTDKERRIHDQINAAYDDYMAAARKIEAAMRGEPLRPLGLAEFEAFERQSRRMLSLGFELAGAHRESMNSFVDTSNTALSYLQLMLVIALGLLLLAGGGLAIMVYRELIAPLRVKLVENQALIERQEKLAALGMLAAGMAHEIRNPLTAIKAWLFIQQKHLEPNTPEEADAKIITKEVNRLERIVKDVLVFAKPSEPHFVIVPALEPLNQVAALLGPQLEKNAIQLRVETSAATQVRIDPQQMQQVLINLVLNAAESIGENGTVTLRVRTGLAPLANRMAEAAILEVADTGKGIPAEVEKRLFDPFFTTKETGTGLGLSIAARIVEKHGGALQYQTRVHHGTVFGIVLPRA